MNSRRFTLGLLAAFAALKVSTEPYWIGVNGWAVGRMFQVRDSVYPPSGETTIVIVREDNESRKRLDTADLRKVHPKLIQALSSPLIKVIAFDHEYQLGSDYNEEFAKAIEGARSKIVLGSDTTVAAVRGATSNFGHLYRITFFGRTTHVPAAVTRDGLCILSLGAKAVALFYSLGERDVECGDQVTIGPGFQLATNTRYWLRINYIGRANAFQSISYADAIDRGSQLAGDLTADGKSKIVLVGETEPREIVETPVGRMAGVEIHANVIATLLRQRYLRDVSELENWLFLFALVLFVTVLTIEVRRTHSQPKARRYVLVIVCGLLAVVYVALSVVAFVVSGVVNAVVLYAGVIALALGATLVMDWRKFLPGPVRLPTKEIMSMLSAFLVALMFGRDVVTAMVLATLTSVVLWSIPRIPRWMAGFGASMVLMGMFVGPGEAQPPRCGTVSVIRDKVSPGANETKRVTITRQRAVVTSLKNGDAMFHGDYLFWEEGVSFRIDWDDSSRTVMESSRQPYKMEVECREKLLTIKISGFWGRVLAFVAGGGRMEILPDDFGRIGTIETVFKVSVDQKARGVHVEGVEGILQIVDRSGKKVIVKGIETASIDADSKVHSTGAANTDGLSKLKYSIVDLLRVGNLEQSPQSLKAVAIVESSIGKEKGAVNPLTRVYAIQGGDTLQKVMESNYPASVVRSAEQSDAIKSEIGRINPWLPSSGAVRAGDTIVLPTLRGGGS